MSTYQGEINYLRQTYGNIRLHIVFLLLFSFHTASLESQNCLISAQTSLRNDFAYYLIPTEQSRAVLLHDKSLRFTMQRLQENLEWTEEINIQLKGKKWEVMECLREPNGFGVYYLSHSGHIGSLIYSIFNVHGILLQEDTIISGEDWDIYSGFKTKFSENQDWICLGYSDRQDQRRLLLYNHKTKSEAKEILLSQIIADKEMRVPELQVSNDGNIYLLGIKNESEFLKKKFLFNLFSIDTSGNVAWQKEYNYEEMLPLHFLLQYDNVEKKLILAGTYTKKGSSPSGYFINTITSRGVFSEPIFEPFGEKMIQQWTGTKKKEIKDLDLVTRQVVCTNTGAILLFLENNKELTRRSYPYQNAGPLNGTRWVDFYFEDIAVASFSAAGNKMWERVLYKRQFSQDDEGLYSSFFLLRTDDFLRLIFNDEIEEGTTVSEYIIGPDGRNMRKSILNTGKKDIHLRLTDAVQVEADKLLVPSESNGKMSVVIMDFSPSISN